MTATAIAPQRLAPGHTILRDSRWPKLWTCTCRAEGSGDIDTTLPPAEIDMRHLEFKFSRAADL
ncbi:hypothetical protein Cme02nite_38610 [Catellatospora methionotrophica]|uniref:Uncharacterized protein n=1 Tax=Catellatospora methionotrophica TaxID=121620 RepID=A0A8J3PGB1_9ACTN|nr:hypothetical protein [Catellatospora methionotrophica]GIG15529.1 hypothetical protein Cme02nite_38610 [Catellatospora methionotrophica]